MTVRQEMTLAMFSEQTITTVNKMFETKEERKPIDAYDISFRLFLVNNSTINFEFGYTTPFGFYFKPIGFFKNNLESYILYEFEESFEYLKTNNYLNNNIHINKLSIRDNAVIATFSIDTILEVFKTFEEIKIKGYEPEFRDGIMIPPNLKYDKKIVLNGLKSELIMAFQGYPQFYLDDEYKVPGAIGAYQMIDNKLRVNPIIDFSSDYNKLYEASLLSAYKNLKNS